MPNDLIRGAKYVQGKKKKKSVDELIKGKAQISVRLRRTLI